MLKKLIMDLGKIQLKNTNTQLCVYKFQLQYLNFKSNYVSFVTLLFGYDRRM